ncbi:MAG: hypothetical protein R2807_01360 [Chitinophagales bacterium]
MQKTDIQTITFLIGHRELGKNWVKISKEQKQDLMHIGVCALLSRAQYYTYITLMKMVNALRIQS